jgi:hypothetical protein
MVSHKPDHAMPVICPKRTASPSPPKKHKTHLPQTKTMQENPQHVTNRDQLDFHPKAQLKLQKNSHRFASFPLKLTGRAPRLVLFSLNLETDLFLEPKPTANLGFN